jgi:zinc/manganese transport system permease protein
MSFNPTELSIIVPAFGLDCWYCPPMCRWACRYKRGIVFIDLAIAQIAGVGVVLAASWVSSRKAGPCRSPRWAPRWPGALLLTWTGKYPGARADHRRGFHPRCHRQCDSACRNVHANENLRDLLVGQILWVPTATSPLSQPSTP